jgi:hypothetical protein
MNKEDISYIRSNKKWKFKFSDIFYHYIIIFFPLSIIFISLSMFYGGNKFGHLTGDFLITSIVGLLFGVLMLIFIITRILSEMNFINIELGNLTFEEFKKTVKKNDWLVIQNKDEKIVLITKPSFFSWGEKVTILKDRDNMILVNSRPERQPITINRDKINYTKLTELIKHNC